MNRFRLYLIALAAVVATLAFAPRAEAQTITACSANKSGSMYRVGTTGMPADCTNANHKKETWNVQGPQGPQGPQGAQGVQGPQGVPGITGYVIVSVDYSLPVGNMAWGPYLACPSGKRAIGGGIGSTGWGSSQIHLSYSAPTEDGTGWEVSATNSGTTAIAVRGRVICATIAP